MKKLTLALMIAFPWVQMIGMLLSVLNQRKKTKAIQGQKAGKGVATPLPVVKGIKGGPKAGQAGAAPNADLLGAIARLTSSNQGFQGKFSTRPFGQFIR